MSNRMSNTELRLGKPYLSSGAAGVRLCCDVRIREEKKTVWFEVKEEWAQYLTDDRADAFAVLYLPTAMRERMNIRSESPISRRLLYQINHYLIPTLSRNIDIYHSVSLMAEPADKILSREGAVATGWTGGVDSMFTLMNTHEAKEPSRRLTHLLIANNGALQGQHNAETLQNLVERARNGIASEKNLKVVGINTNLDRELPEHYLSVVGYRLPATALSLQKLFSVYYHSSTYEYEKFSFIGDNCGYYEMILIPALSTEKTVFYSYGGAVPRIEKLRRISDYPPAQKYLHPCIHSRYNCCSCKKCISTELSLYALGTLNRFGQVFDLDTFKQDKDRYIAEVIEKKDQLYSFGEAYKQLKQKGLITPHAESIVRIRRVARNAAGKNREMLNIKTEENNG